MTLVAGGFRLSLVLCSLSFLFLAVLSLFFAKAKREKIAASKPARQQASKQTSIEVLLGESMKLRLVTLEVTYMTFLFQQLLQCLMSSFRGVATRICVFVMGVYTEERKINLGIRYTTLHYTHCSP